MKKIILAGFLLLSPTFSAFGAEYTFTMEEAVRQAIKANPQKIMSEKYVEASRSSLSASRSAFGPSLDLRYELTHMPADHELRQNPNHSENTVTFFLELSQPIFTGFELLNTAQKAELEVEKKELDLMRTKIDIATQVQAAFLQYLMAVESVASSQKSLERAKVQLETATSGFNIGLRPKIDVLQAQYDMTSTEAILIENENSRERFKAQLNSLLNIPVESDTDYVGNLDLIPFQMEFNSAVNRAFANLPDIQIAQKTMEQAGKDLGIAKGSFLPTVAAAIRYTATGDQLDASSEYQKHEDTNYVLQFEWNLFKSGQRYFKVKEVKSTIDALTAAVELAYNTAALNVKTTLLQLQDATRTVDVATRALDSARQSYEDAKVRYESQLGTNLEMLTAQSDLADAELAFISSKANYLIALSSFYAAIGEIHPNLDKEVL